MSDTSDVLEAMRVQLRELEMDHVQLAGRILQLGHDIALLEHGPRRRSGRPRKVHDAEDAELPSLDDARGILSLSSRETHDLALPLVFERGRADH